jgi:putative oxidoreductase
MAQSKRYAQERAEAVVVTALRAMVGLIFVVHGAMKLMDIPGTVQSFAHLGIPYPQHAVYLAIAGEFFGGLGILFGLLTRVAALGALCVMAVAVGYVHFGHGLLAQKGGWEYPVVLGLVALYFVTHGAGPASVDAYIRRRRYSTERYSRSDSRSERVRSYA